jgi:hypothetical protein
VVVVLCRGGGVVSWWWCCVVVVDVVGVGLGLGEVRRDEVELPVELKLLVSGLGMVVEGWKPGSIGSELPVGMMEVRIREFICRQMGWRHTGDQRLEGGSSRLQVVELGAKTSKQGSAKFHADSKP